jgi:hypothetical protein
MDSITRQPAIYTRALAVAEFATQVPRDSRESKRTGGRTGVRQMAEVDHGDDN